MYIYWINLIEGQKFKHNYIKRFTEEGTKFITNNNGYLKSEKRRKIE